MTRAALAPALSATSAMRVSAIPRSGMSTIVLEARSKVGGAAATDAPWPDAPDFKVTTYSYVVSLMPERIVSDLKLARHGYKVYPMGPYYVAFPDGSALTLGSEDPQADHDSIARFSKRDADAYPKWRAWMGGMAEVLTPLLMSTPPKVGSKRPRDLFAQARLAWRMRGLDTKGVGDVTRLMSMSISDLLDEWFESTQIKATLAVDGIIGTWAGPMSPGTAYVLAHHEIGDAGGGLGSWGYPEGGMGAVSEALRRAAESFGATVRTGARVSRILTGDGRALGVVLDDGTELSANVIVATTHPHITFLDQLAPSD